jgi:flavin reductase (DIM6/NTAB) family NADH-FMN oxidoreductase RutF
LDAHRLDGEQPSEADIDRYRLLSADISSGVAVVSTSLRKRDYAATVSAFLSVSYDPPTMLVSLYADSRIADAVATTGRWGLSLLGSKHQGTANWLASPGTPIEGLLAQVPYHRGPATGSVILEGSIAYFELRTVAVHPAATHLLIVGEVLSMGSDATDAQALDPLIHFASDYHRLAH